MRDLRVGAHALDSRKSPCGAKGLRVADSYCRNLCVSYQAGQYAGLLTCHAQLVYVRMAHDVHVHISIPIKHLPLSAHNGVRIDQYTRCNEWKYNGQRVDSRSQHRKQKAHIYPTISHVDRLSIVPPIWLSQLFPIRAKQRCTIQISLSSIILTGFESPFQHVLGRKGGKRVLLYSTLLFNEFYWSRVEVK